jgi:CDP-diacylglycerol--serine O-phosphatidyltransferase
MNQRSPFIVSLNWIDMLTLGSLLLSCFGLMFALQNWLTLAIASMVLAMFVDMLDGLLARRMKMESEFGKYLDGFCDVFTYLILPLFILFQMGMQDLSSLAVLFVFLVCGILRLSRFNIVGVLEEQGVAYHLGLQVIWSQLLVVLAFPAWHWLGDHARYVLVPLLLAMSVYMIRNLRFPKPTRYALQTFLLLAVAATYVYLHLIGVRTP